MLHQKYDDVVDVEVVFLQRKVMPRKLHWQGVVYQINQLAMVHTEWIGRQKVYYFSVSDGSNFFRLAFFTHTLQWRLQELYAA